MNEQKKQIVKDAFTFTGARYISQGIGFFTAIAMRRFLGPFLMGIWSLLKVIIDYTLYMQLGAERGVNYQIPFLTGQGKKESADETKNIGFSFVLIVSLITSFLLICAAFILKNRYPVEIFVGLLFLSVYVVIVRLASYYQLLLRAYKDFSILSKAIVAEAVLNLILILILVRVFSIYGLYMSATIVVLSNLMIMHHLAKYKIKFTVDIKKILEVVRIGLPMIMVGFLHMTLASLDRIMIAKFIGVTFVGFYSIPIMARTYTEQLSASSTVVYPRMLESYGESENAGDLEKLATVPPLVNAYVLSVILGSIFLLGPFFIKQILPKFVPSILAMKILLLDIFFRTSYVQAIQSIYAFKKYTRLIPLAFLMIILNAAGNYFFIQKGFGIYGVAWATSIVNFIYFLILQFYALGHFWGIKKIIKFICKIITPLLYMTVVVLVLDRYVGGSEDLKWSFIRWLMMLIASSPLIYYINRRTGILNYILKIVLRSGD